MQFLFGFVVGLCVGALVFCITGIYFITKGDRDD